MLLQYLLLNKKVILNIRILINVYIEICLVMNLLQILFEIKSRKKGQNFCMQKIKKISPELYYIYIYIFCIEGGEGPKKSSLRGPADG